MITGKPGEVWNNTVAEAATTQWLALGGRYIDTALTYGTQEGIGRAIKASGIPRDELWITSKVPAGGIAPGPLPGGINATTDPYGATLASFALVQQQLQVGSVDLLLVHWPSGPADGPFTPAQYRQHAWRALEHILATGGARAVGVSNFEVQHLRDIEALGGKLPAVNQVEFHPYYHEDALVEYCKGKGIQFDAYSPLGVADMVRAAHYWSPCVLDHPAVHAIARAHPSFGPSPAQVVLAWLWGQGIVTHPRSEDAGHMRENLRVAGQLALTPAEMATLSHGLAVPDCSAIKKEACPTAVAKPKGGCCKVCPLTTTIP